MGAFAEGAVILSNTRIFQFDLKGVKHEKSNERIINWFAIGMR